MRGTPPDADLVLDVRFLENPYFVPELKNLPGTDKRVADFVLGQVEAQEFIAKTKDLLTYVIPKYEREGKSYLTIAIGCTGGMHRSVVVSEVLGATLGKVTGTPIAVVHRDVARRDAWGPKPEVPSSSPPAAPGIASDAPDVTRDGERDGDRDQDLLKSDEVLRPPSLSAVERVGLAQRVPPPQRGGR
jgi:hypothetical protein